VDKSAIFAASVSRGSAGSRNCVIGREIGGLPGWLEGGGGGGVELRDVARLTRLFPSGPGGTLSAPGDDAPCPVNCRWGTI